MSMKTTIKVACAIIALSTWYVIGYFATLLVDTVTDIYQIGILAGVVGTIIVDYIYNDKV